MRTLIGASCQFSACMTLCTAIAAPSASDAVENAAQNASPTVLKTTPQCAVIASRITSSCRASATLMASGYRCHSVVLPSMSVNRKVTVPVGNSESARVVMLAWGCSGARTPNGAFCGPLPVFATWTCLDPNGNSIGFNVRSRLRPCRQWVDCRR